MGPAASNPQLWEQQTRSWTVERMIRVGARLFVCATIWFGAAVCQQRLWSGQTSVDGRSTNKEQQKAGFNAHPQQMNAAEREITVKIRRAIAKDKSLSTFAHSIKILTQNGDVSLQGPVRSEEEKAALEAKAAEIVGAERVQSKLSVVPKRTNSGP